MTNQPLHTMDNITSVNEEYNELEMQDSDKDEITNENQAVSSNHEDAKMPADHKAATSDEGAEEVNNEEGTHAPPQLDQGNIIDILWDCIETGNCASLRSILECPIKRLDVAPLCEMIIYEACNFYTYAGKIGSNEVVEMLWNYGIDIGVKDNAGNSILHTAITSGHTSLVMLIVAHYKDNVSFLDGVNLRKKTALHIAVNGQKGDLVGGLLSNGATADVFDYAKRTPLHYAATMDESDIVNNLITSGATVNIEDGKGCTPLFYAAKRGRSDNVALLLSSGADAEKKNKKHVSPLHVASYAGHTVTVEQLITHGCDAFNDDDNLEMPIISALRNEKMEVVKLIMDKSKSPLSVFKLANVCSMQEMNKIQSMGVFYTHEDAMGQTALHYAAARGKRHSVNNLLRLGLYRKKKDRQGNDPLHIAIAANNNAAVKVLATSETRSRIDANSTNQKRKKYRLRLCVDTPA